MEVGDKFNIRWDLTWGNRKPSLNYELIGIIPKLECPSNDRVKKYYGVPETHKSFKKFCNGMKTDRYCFKEINGSNNIVIPEAGLYLCWQIKGEEDDVNNG